LARAAHAHLEARYVAALPEAERAIEAV